MLRRESIRLSKNSDEIITADKSSPEEFVMRICQSLGNSFGIQVLFELLIPTTEFRSILGMTFEMVCYYQLFGGNIILELTISISLRVAPYSRKLSTRYGSYF